MKRFFALLLLSLGLWGASFAQFDATRYLLADATLQKLTAVQSEIERLGLDTSHDLASNDSVEVMARKIEANTAVRDLLAKQGLTPLDCALTVNAMLYAGTVLMAEQNGETIRAQAMLASATPEQRANVALLRRAAK